MVPTCSPERAKMLAFVLGRMEAQTTPPDYVALMDYPKIRKGPDLAERYKNGVNKCFEKGCDFVLFIEDDDYYPKDYIETMFSLWIQNNKPHVIGCSETTYYHIFTRGWLNIKTITHSSAHGTAVGRGVDVLGCSDENIYFDIELWKRNSKNSKLVYFPNHCISIKHGIGLCGGGGHTNTHYRIQDDEQYTKLKELLDEDGFDFYLSVIAEEKEKQESLKQNNPLCSEYYDRIYKTSPEYKKEFPELSIYFQVWEEVVKRISIQETILELGCGTGLFAKYAIACEKKYQRGVDFSPTAIQKSKEINPTHENKFAVKDLNGTQFIPSHLTVVALEVLEHLEDDLKILSKMQTNTHVLFSVPDFLCDGHQRCFKTEQEVSEYYSEVVNFIEIKKIKITETNSIFLIDGRKK